jgi:hypothetical protein
VSKVSPHLRLGNDALSAQVKADVLPVAKPEPRKRSRRAPRRAADREAIYTYAFQHPDQPTCWLKQFSVKERACEGRMDRAHLVEQQTLKKEGHPELCPDPRTWVPACRWHHTQFDGHFGVQVPRSALPVELEKLCEEIGLGWYLDRRFGERVEEAA